MKRILGVLLLLAGLVLTAGNHVVMADETYRLRVDGLACPFCAYGAEKKLKALQGVKRVKVYINKGVIVLTLRQGAVLSRQQVERLIKEAGFSLRGFERG